MATIIINDVTPRVAYTVSSVPQAAFSVPFPFFDDSDLRVIQTAGGVGITLTLGTHYTVVGAGLSQGGTVNMILPVTNCALTIKRALPLKRTTDFPLTGPFPIGALNDDLDKIVCMVQQIADQFTRTVRLREDDPFTGIELPDPATRADKAFVFGPDGAPTVSTDSFNSVVTRAESAVQSAQQIAQQVNQVIADAQALLEQAQVNALPTALVADAGKPVVVTGNNTFGVGPLKADATLANVSNADFQTKATAAGVGGGGGGFSNPFAAELYGGSY
ncbi:hypothetical protein [Azospirillum sp. sgz301742]